MSGPKSSRYTLTTAQLRKLQKEQEELRKLLEEKERKERESKEARKSLADIKAKIERHLRNLQTSEKRLSSTTPVSELRDKYDSIYSLIEQANKLCAVKSDTPHSVLVRSAKKASSLLDEVVSSKGNIIADTDKAVAEQRMQEDSLIAEGMNISFENIGYAEEEKAPIFKEVIHQLEELSDMNLSTELADDVQKAIRHNEQIEDASLMKNFLAITVEPLRKRCQDYVLFAKHNGEQFNALSDEYKVLCKQLDIPEKEIVFSEKGLKELEELIPVMRCQAEYDATQTYIRESIDDVMSEMGYKVIGHRHVRKKSGKEFNSKLLTYEDGTAINITETSDGRITMEIGGIDQKDREPDYNERTALRKTMDSFCTDFHEIEKKLATRGVILGERLSMAPQEEIYAQIININDYEITGDYQTSTKRKAVTNTSKAEASDK